MESNIEEKVNQHTKDIENRNFKPPECPCPKCHELPDTYKPHEYPVRIVRFIIDNVVVTISTLLIRWKCTLCRKTFTQYPYFLLPYKQYTVVDILRLSESYLENDDLTYRDVANFNGNLIFHKDRNENIPDDRYFAPATIWRWLDFLGADPVIIDEALNQIRQKAAGNTLFRQIFPIVRHKYLSLKRKMILENARKLIHINKAFIKLFGNDIFPVLRI